MHCLLDIIIWFICDQLFVFPLSLYIQKDAVVKKPL